jgi:hypothetical protein
MLTYVRDDIGWHGASVGEERTQRIRFGNAIPRIEPFVEIRPLCTHGIPKYAVYRFKKAGAPSGNSKLPTWTNVSPKLGDCSPHVWHEKNAKDANYGIERGRRQLQIKQVADAKFGVFEASISSLGSRKSQQIICEVDTKDRPSGANRFCRWDRGRATAAAYIKHTPSRIEAQARDGATTIPLPKGIDWMVVEIGSRVVRNSSSLFRVGRGAHARSSRIEWTSVTTALLPRRVTDLPAIASKQTFYGGPAAKLIRSPRAAYQK